MQTIYSKINNVCLIVLAGIGITVALIYTSAILVPFVISLFIFAIGLPSVNWLQRKAKLPRFLAVLIILFTVLVALSVIIVFITNSLGEFFQSAHIYRDKIVQFMAAVSSVATRLGIEINDASIRQTIGELPVLAIAQNLTGGLLSLLGNAVLVMVFVLFLFIGGSHESQGHPLAEEIQNKVSRYISTKFFTSITTGVLVAVVLGLCGVELAFMFGVLTVLLNFIPSIGSIIATLLPLPVVILQFGFGWQFFVVVSVTGLIQFAIGNVIEPKMMGESMDLHPVAVLLFLMFWGLVWGVAGMFLAVPITAILRIILSRIDATKPLAELLAGRLAA